MIDDPKLERHIGTLRDVARRKDDAAKKLEQARAVVPLLINEKEQVDTEYEVALDELAAYVKSQ